jgi:hypothetical protein
LPEPFHHLHGLHGPRCELRSRTDEEGRAVGQGWSQVNGFGPRTYLGLLSLISP